MNLDNSLIHLMEKIKPFWKWLKASNPLIQKLLVNKIKVLLSIFTEKF
jgi:hypothetical protein